MSNETILLDKIPSLMRSEEVLEAVNVRGGGAKINTVGGISTI